MDSEYLIFFIIQIPISNAIKWHNLYFLSSVLQRRICMHIFCKYTLFNNGIILALSEKHQTETTRLSFLLISFYTLRDDGFIWLLFRVNVIGLSIGKC